MTHSPSIEIVEGPRPGALDAVVSMHAAYYARAWAFGSFFEDKVRREMGEFLARYDDGHDCLFLALAGDRIAGSLVIDGGEPDVASTGAHLRWFVVDEAHHGQGVGKALMKAAMAFVSEKFPACYLTTFAGLEPARALYERAGFKLVSETPAESWGRRVTEQRFEWVR